MATTPESDAPAGRWPALAATAVGSMPGADVREATSVVLGELEVPHLPELPQRGAGADLVGRTAALLSGVSADLGVSTTTDGWRLSGAPGRDVRRAVAWLGEDLDTLAELADGYQGPLTVALAGPWTLAASLELATGERALRDAGACRDLAEALAEAAARHVREVARRVPGAAVQLQLDEPSLTAVAEGSVPTASGWSRLRAPGTEELVTRLAHVVTAARDAGAGVLVHSCASRPRYDVLLARDLLRAGLGGWSFDLRLHHARDDERLGELLDAGVRLVLGALPVGPAEASVVADSVGLVQEWSHRLGADLDTTAGLLAVSPTCGLAGASPAGARATLAATAEVARRLRQQVGP